MSKITGKVNYKEVLKGDTGYTYKPHVTVDGVLYWSNDGNLPNPLPVNIKGEKGETDNFIIKCSEIGLIANNELFSKDNTEKLVKKINDGYKILVDDVYYLETLNKKINNIIEMVGISTNSKFIIKKNESNLFNVTEFCHGIKIKNIEFKNQNMNGFVILNVNEPISVIKNIEIINSKFINNLSCIRWHGKTNINPFEINFGLDYLVFKNNVVKNTRMSFIILQDVPFNNVSIENNDITNFDYIFLNCSITNEHSFLENIQKNMKNVIVTNNNVMFTEDWWGDESNEGYLCFVLTETMKVNYTYNFVSGLKSKGLTALYDAYLSSLEVNYNYNTWINNICFNANKEYNTLIKAKGVNIKSGNRKYTNNKFIIEKEFANKLNQDVELLKIEFLSCTSNMDLWEIRDNEIMVYSIIFPKGSQPIKEYIFINNTIKTEKAEGYIINLRLIENVDYSKCQSKIENNNIYCNSIDINKNFSLFRMSKSNNETIYGNLIIKNNLIFSNVFNYLIYEGYILNCSILNNTIKNVYENKNNIGNGYIYSGVYKDINCQNNVIDYNSSNGSFFRNKLNGKINGYLINQSNINNGYVYFDLPKENTFQGEYKYKINIIIENFDKKSDIEFNFTLISDGNKNKILFTDVEDNVINSEIGNNQNNNKKIKVTGTDNMKLYLLFKNTLDNNKIILQSSEHLDETNICMKVSTF